MRTLELLGKALAIGSLVLLTYGIRGLCLLDSSLGDKGAQQVQSSLVEGYSLAATVGVAMLLASLQTTYKMRGRSRPAPDEEPGPEL